MRARKLFRNKKLFVFTLGIMCLVASGCQPRHFKDFDVGSLTFDPNVFPLNPKWGKQIEQNTLPNPAQSCPIESDSDNPDDWTKSSQFPNCMTDPPTFNGALFCGPHVNLVPVAYEGTVKWDDHSSSLLDDDYTLNVFRDDQALYSTAASDVHIEFDSDETVDNWDDTHTWWDNFHHNAVDDSKAAASAMIDGSFVKVIGLLNLDALHRGKTELHPVYSMFVKVKGADSTQSSWAFFVRNWGDQGFCGDDDQPLSTRQQLIKVLIPNVAGLTSNNIWEGAQNDDNLSPMSVTVQPSGNDVLLIFNLLSPGKQSWFVGDISFVARQPVVIGNPASGGTIPSALQPEGDPDKGPDAELQARIDRLPKAEKDRLYAQMKNLIPRKKAFQVKPVLMTEQAKLEEESHKSPVRVAIKRELDRPLNPSTAKVNRQKRVEFAKKYLAEKKAK